MFELLEQRLAMDASLDLINVPAEQRDYGFTGKSDTVAIIDTGIDYNNPAFAGHILDGYNFVSNTADYMDDNGHGTHVSGIVLETAPDVHLVILKVLDNTGTGTFNNIELALQWVAAHETQDHIVAINMSLGSGSYVSAPVDGTPKAYADSIFNDIDSTLQTLVTDNIFISSASGNGWVSNSTPGLAYPAISQYVVSVGAVYAEDDGANGWITGARDSVSYPDKIASFTQRSDQLDLLAPGVKVDSTYLWNSRVALTGTSMASPFVTAASVLVREAMESESLSVNQADILKVLKTTGKQIVDADLGQDNVPHTNLTFARIDVYAAVHSIMGDPLTPDQKYIDKLYKQLLDRHADPAGLNYWVSQLTSHGRPYVVSSLYNSHEYQSKQPDYLTSQDYFFELLGREPEPDAKAYFDHLTRQQAISIITASTEYRTKVVISDYETLLHREPGTSEVNYWLGTKLTTDQITQFFLESQEYYAN